MSVTKFKKELRNRKESLRGKSIMIIKNGEGQTFNKLWDLGMRILEEEGRGYSFSFLGDTTIKVETGINMSNAINQFGTNS